MKIAPLIHSRTGQCDYNSKFAVRPNGFSKYLVPEWEKKSARTIEVDYLSWDKVKLAHVTDHGTEFYDSAAFNEESLFEEYLARALTEEVAFCSNVENIQAVEDGIYTAVTTSASNVDKLKANMERKRREREEQLRREKEESERQKNNLVDFVDSFNNTWRDCVLVDEQT